MAMKIKWRVLLIVFYSLVSELPIWRNREFRGGIFWGGILFFYKNQLFLAEAQLFLFLNSILTSFQPWPPLNYMFKMLLVISSLRFPDQFTSSMNIFQNINFKISNLRLAVLIKVVLIKKVYFFFYKNSSSIFGTHFYSFSTLIPAIYMLNMFQNSKSPKDTNWKGTSKVKLAFLTNFSF